MDQRGDGLGTAMHNNVKEGLATTIEGEKMSAEHSQGVLQSLETPSSGGISTSNTARNVQGLGTALNYPKGLAKSREVSKHKDGSIMPIIQKLGLGIGDLSLGVAKNVEEMNVIMTGVKSTTKKRENDPPPPQKTPNFKAKKKPNKIPLPDWLVKWQSKTKTTTPKESKKIPPAKAQSTPPYHPIKKLKLKPPTNSPKNLPGF